LPLWNKNGLSGAYPLFYNDL